MGKGKGMGELYCAILLVLLKASLFPPLSSVSFFFSTHTLLTRNRYRCLFYVDLFRYNSGVDGASMSTLGSFLRSIDIWGRRLGREVTELVALGWDGGSEWWFPLLMMLAARCPGLGSWVRGVGFLG